MYRAGDGPDRAVLSHVVSCATCLDAVNSALGLKNSSARGFGESDGPQPPGLRSNDTSRKKLRDPRRQAGKWSRSALDIFEHQPRELMIVLNGSPVAWQTVAPGRTDFSVRVQQPETVEFIEVFSEQEVRLVSLAVPATPPPPDLEWSNEVSLSDGRSLTVRLRFETLGPEISITYFNPTPVDAPATLRAALSAEPILPRWRGFLRLRWALLAFAFAALILLMWPGRQTTASAATLLVRVQAAERTTGTQPGLVSHRSLRMEERLEGHTEVLSRHRIEVWRDGRKDARIRRLYADDGTPLATATEANTARPGSAADVWKYEPTSDNFELLAGDPTAIAAVDEGKDVRLTAPSAGLTVRKDDWHIVSGYVILEGREYRFTETGFELIHSESSPWTESASAAAPHLDSPKLLAAPDSIAAPATNGINQIELDCRYALHQIGADTGYPIDIHTESDEGKPRLLLSGLVPTSERRQEIERALGSIPSVHIALKTEEEAALESLPPVREHAEIRVASEPSPIEEQLRSHFDSPAAIQRFTRDTLAANDRLMSHAWALRRLAERYPSATAARFSPASRRKLDEMNLDHQRAMLDALIELTTIVDPVIKPFADAPRPEAATNGSLFDLAHQVEQWTLALVSGSGPNGPAARTRPGSAARELLDALSRLRERLAP
jgi:hypothetical protein